MLLKFTTLLLLVALIHCNILQLQSAPYQGYYIVLSKVVKQNYISCNLQYYGSQTSYITPDNLIQNNLVFNLTFDGVNEISFKIQSSTNEVVELPYKIPFPFNKQALQPGDQPQFKVQMANNFERFYLTITRTDTGEDIFRVDRNDPFIFSLYFYQITTQVVREKLYGFGERRQHLLFQSGSYSIYNKDQPTHNEDGKPNGQLYGSHPMWLRKGLQNKYHVGFLRNAHGMVLDYQQNKSMTFKMTGGVMEFKFFIGNEPEESITAYHKYVNGFSLHPFWSMGFHLCRWGWLNSTEWKQVWLDAIQNDVYFDTLWNDIDYMKDYEDFTIDTKRYDISVMQEITDRNTINGVHWIPIIDAGIYIHGNAGTQGLAQDLFIKSVQYNQPLQGCVWPGNTYYVDFNHPASFDFWEQGLRNISKDPYNGPVPSGIWIDMNEFSNFVVGEMEPGKTCNAVDFSTQSVLKEIQSSSHDESGDVTSQVLRRTASLAESLTQTDGEYPWSPMGPSHPFNEKTLSQNATHYSKEDAQFISTKNIKIQEFDFHNLDGFTEGIATNKALLNMGQKMPFIISRSTMFGSGAYVQHWNGDNYASWVDLELSIPEIMNFQFFGIPMNGDDICGFAGNTNAELCARWLQLGLFYPFARDHNQINQRDQYPWSFPDSPYVLSSAKNSIFLRYSLLKYYYHQFVKLNGVGTIFKPLFFEFPDENLDDFDAEFMIGKELLFAPVVRPGNSKTQFTTHTIYIPSGAMFYDFYTGAAQTQGYNTVQQPFDSTIPIFIRAGYIVHQQPNKFNRVRYADNHFNLLIAVDASNQATGTMLQIDNYNDEDTFIKQCTGDINCLINISASVKVLQTQSHQAQSGQLQLTISVKKSSEQTQFTNPGVLIDGVVLYGCSSNKIEYKFDQAWNVVSEDTQQYTIIY